MVIIMKLILNDYVNTELKEYLLMQNGIIDVSIDNKKYMTKLDIKYDENITPEIIMRHIDLFQNNKYSVLFEFDKELKGKFKTLKYTIDDMCCEYCYMGLVMDLFENEKIESVKSNFDFNKSAFNIEFKIEYEEGYKEEELIKYIKEKYK